MNKNLNQLEQLSALVDGQLEGDEFVQALQFAKQDDGRSSWQLYHLVGDVLRSPELASQTDSGVFLARLQERLAQEPAVGRPTQETLQQIVLPQVVPLQAANASVFRWKMLAGFASLAAVAVVGWNSWGSLQTGATTRVQLAVAVPTPPQPTVTVAETQEPQVMIRDPRLDELLAAHKQFGGTSALQMPAGFLRNATFEAPTR